MSTVGTKLEDNLNFLENGKRPQFFVKIEDDLNLRKMEDDLNFKEKKNNLNVKVCGRWHQFFHLFLKMKDNLNFEENGRRPQIKENGRRP